MTYLDGTGPGRRRNLPPKTADRACETTTGRDASADHAEHVATQILVRDCALCRDAGHGLEATPGTTHLSSSQLPESRAQRLGDRL